MHAIAHGEQRRSAMSIEATPPPEQLTTLRSNAIGLPGVLFQSVTTMAPAGAVAFSLGAAIPFTGGALPLAVAIALVACVLVVLNIGQMARYLPSAGGYFTYVTRGLGPQAGWLAGWLFTFTYILFLPLTLLVLGSVTDAFLSSTFHLSLGANGWVLYAAIFAAVAFALTFFGIKISAYPNDPNPWGTMAALVWGPVAFIAILAILNSALGNANASINAGARMLFSMGRIKALPGVLGQTNRFRVPGLAIILMLVLGIGIMLWAGLVYGPTLGFAFIGATLTVPLLLVYMATCLAVPFFYWREHRSEFNVWQHVILPAIPFVLLGIDHMLPH